MLPLYVKHDDLDIKRKSLKAGKQKNHWSHKDQCCRALYCYFSLHKISATNVKIATFVICFYGNIGGKETLLLRQKVQRLFFCV